MGHPGRLAGLTLAAIYHAERPPPALITDGIAAVPEFRIAGFVDDLFQGAMELAVFDFPEEIPAKLKIDPVLIYRKTASALDVDSILCIGNEFSGS